MTYEEFEAVNFEALRRGALAGHRKAIVTNLLEGYMSLRDFPQRRQCSRCCQKLTSPQPWHSAWVGPDAKQLAWVCLSCGLETPV